MSKEIERLNKLLEKLEKNIEFIKTGAVVSGSCKQPLKVNRIMLYKEREMYLMMTEQVGDYIVFDRKTFDEAIARKETIK